MAASHTTLPFAMSRSCSSAMYSGRVIPLSAQPKAVAKPLRYDVFLDFEKGFSNPTQHPLLTASRPNCGAEFYNRRVLPGTVLLYSCFAGSAARRVG